MTPHAPAPGASNRGPSTPAIVVPPDAERAARALLDVAERGLPEAFDPRSGSFAHTMRLTASSAGHRLDREGSSLRYSAIVALGLGRSPAATQSAVLGGLSLLEFVSILRSRASGELDAGAVALVAWAGTELTGSVDDVLLERLRTELLDADPLHTVETAWMLSAAVAALRASPAGHAVASHVATLAANLLHGAEGAHGIYPHTVLPGSSGRLRAHIGSFASQVFALQALARLAGETGDRAALEAANRTAARICELQGPGGQWWWHYDSRNGQVVEGYPVYSAHQHAMAPMALFDLVAAGGEDHTSSACAGLSWMAGHAETTANLVSEEHGTIWRKVGRRERSKAVRAASALTTAVRPGLRLPGLDTLFPARVVDYECRPYELGWLLYAWQPVLSPAGAPEPSE